MSFEHRNDNDKFPFTAAAAVAADSIQLNFHTHKHTHIQTFTYSTPYFVVKGLINFKSRKIFPSSTIGKMFPRAGNQATAAAAYNVSSSA